MCTQLYLSAQSDFYGSETSLTVGTACTNGTNVGSTTTGGTDGLGCFPITYNMTTIVGDHYTILITPRGASNPGTDSRYLCLTSATPSVPGGGVATNDCSSAPFISGNTTYTINNANALGTEPSLCAGSSENTLFAQWTTPADWNNPTYIYKIIYQDKIYSQKLVIKNN